MSEAARPNIQELQAEIRAAVGDARDLYVVYLDDEEDLLSPFSDEIERLGFKCFTTTSVEVALEFTRAHRGEIVFIFSDFTMPRMDGFEFRKQLLGICPEAPFAILSAHVDRAMALKGIDLKISGFVDKPFEFAKVAELLRRKSLPRVQAIRDDRELRQGFILETGELIDSTEELLLKLEQEPSELDPLNRFFGIVHTIKGASSFFEPKTMHHFAHRYEELLKRLQRGELQATPAVVTALFAGMDVLKELLAEFKSGQFAERDLEALATATFSFDADDTSARATPSRGSAPAAPTEPRIDTPKAPDDIKISVSLLDEFMQMSGEMTVIRNMLNKCVRSIEKQYAGDKDVNALVDLLDELHKVNGGVQSKITELRKVSLRNILKPMPRAVRDVARMLQKEVALELSGEALRVDTSIAEVLKNCLLHLVKNSLDHGIEGPAERERAGKPREGKLLIAAEIRSDQVVMSITDDGKGIHPAAVREKLLKNGSHTAEEIDRMPPADLLAMIFAPGFSTAKQVTDISGRGVGMSMVKDSVEAVGGRIEIESRPGEGTCFRLCMPVPKSVLIMNCLFVQSGEDKFGIAEDEVIRVMQLDADQQRRMIRGSSGEHFLTLGNELIPIVELRSLLRLPIDRHSTDEDSHLAILCSPRPGLARPCGSIRFWTWKMR